MPTVGSEPEWLPSLPLDDAAHRDVGEAGTAIAGAGAADGVGHARQILRIVGEVGDVELFELLGGKRLNG